MPPDLLGRISDDLGKTMFADLRRKNNENMKIVFVCWKLAIFKTKHYFFMKRFDFHEQSKIS